jgi:hypothetical protein
MRVRDMKIFHHRLVVRGNSQLVAEFIGRSRAVSVNDGAGVIPLSLQAHVPQPEDASELRRDVQEIVHQLVREVSPRPGTLPRLHVSGPPPRDQAQGVLGMPRNSLPDVFMYAAQECTGYTPAGIWRTFRWGTDHDAIFDVGEFGPLARHDTPAEPGGEHDRDWVVHRRHLASIEFTTITGPVEPWFREVAQTNAALEFSLVWAHLSTDKAVTLVARQGKLDRRTEMRASGVLSAEGVWF